MKKKRIINAAFSALLAISVLASCGEPEEVEDGGHNIGVAPDEGVAGGIVVGSVSSSPEVTENGYVILLDNGISFPLGALTDNVIPTLGNVTDIMEAPSCLYDGTDKVYTIDGVFTVTSTVCADGFEHVTAFELLSDALVLVSGDHFLTINGDESELDAAFGAPAEDSFGVKRYTLGGGSLMAVTNDGVITSLTISY